MVERASSKMPTKKPVVPMPKSTATVTVACKLPNGILMRLFKMDDVRETTAMGYQTVQKAVQVGEPIQIRGVAIPFGAVPNFRMVGGYALTRGVPRAFWEEWLRQNQDLDLVKNGLIFAHEKTDETVAEARDKKTLKSGLEPIDPDNPPKLSNRKDVRLERYTPENADA